MVKLKNGVVEHFGNFKSGEDFSKEKPLKLKIDKEKREMNAKLHSAGHLLDVGVEKLGLNLEPGKGYHFSNGSYVEYKGKVEDKEKLKKELQEKMDLLMKEGALSKVEVVEYDKIAQFCGGKIPEYLPEGKKARIVSFVLNESKTIHSCPCSGTHIDSTNNRLKAITIKKIAVKKGNTKISYSIE